MQLLQAQRRTGALSAAEADAALSALVTAITINAPESLLSWWNGMGQAAEELRCAAQRYAATGEQSAEGAMESAAKRIDRIRWNAVENFVYMQEQLASGVNGIEEENQHVENTHHR